MLKKKLKIEPLNIALIMIDNNPTMESKPKFFKVTNKKEIHNGFVYQTGLNILSGPFNDDVRESCGPGGLYFTTIKHIKNFYSHGVHLREVFLPTDDPEFKMVQDPTGEKYRANRIILGNKYYLFDPVLVEKFGLNITKNIYIRTNVLDMASAMGRVDILKWWQSKVDINLLGSTTKAIDRASENGHLDVLEWW